MFEGTFSHIVAPMSGTCGEEYINVVKPVLGKCKDSRLQINRLVLRSHWDIST